MRINTLQELEKEQIRKVLEKTHWNMEKTARLLQITLSQLKRKIRKYGIESKGPDQVMGDRGHDPDVPDDLMVSED